MIADVFGHRGTRGVAYLCAALAGPGVVAGQDLPAPTASETVSYRISGETVSVRVHLDSIALWAPDGTTPNDIDSGLTAGQTREYRSERGAWIVSTSPAAGTRAQAFEIVRSLVDGSDVFNRGGVLARPVDAEEAPVVVPGELVVLFEPDTPEADLMDLETAVGLVPLDISNFNSRLRLYHTGEDGDVFDASATLSADPDVVSALPNFIALAQEAGEGRSGVPALSQWHIDDPSDHDINAVEAWALETGSASVTIAIIETFGFDVAHNDLEANLWVNPGDAPPADGVDDDVNGFADDLHGWNFTKACDDPTTPATETDAMCGNDFTERATTHGTAVAGLAAAATGVDGVSGVCPGCTLMLLTTDGGAWGKIQAFLYAKEKGASVINASWSILRSVSDVLEDAIRTAATSGRGGLGIPVVFASGTPDWDICSGSYEGYQAMPEVISVSGSDNQDLGVPGKGHGDCLDLVAPGYHQMAGWGVTSTDSEFDTDGYNPDLPCPAGDYPGEPEYTRCFEGTSASAPITAGVIGLMLSRDPDLTRSEVEQILTETARKIDCQNANYAGAPAGPACEMATPDPSWFSPTHGYGRVDAHAALLEVEPTTTVVSTPAEEARSGVEIGGRLGWTDVSGDPEAVGVLGSGPAAQPTIHVAWFPGGGPSSWMWELQLGLQDVSTPTTDEENLVAALQGSYLFGSGAATPYVGASFAGQRVDASGSTTTDTAWGGSLGYRHMVTSSFALRVEARGRYWNKRAATEWGLAVAFGAMLH